MIVRIRSPVGRYSIPRIVLERTTIWIVWCEPVTHAIEHGPVMAIRCDEANVSNSQKG